MKALAHGLLLAPALVAGAVCGDASVPIQKFLPAFCVCLKGAPAEPFN